LIVWPSFRDRPRPSKHPHDMPDHLGIETMNASSVRGTYIDVTIRSPESCD
jgi:hypothetical protein